MRNWIYTLPLLLAACATPQEIMQTPPSATMNLQLSPEQAAACISRNIERRAGNILSDRRPNGAGWELIARVVGEVTTVYAIAQLQPAGAGSRATLWTVQDGSNSAAQMAAVLAKDC